MDEDKYVPIDPRETTAAILAGALFQARQSYFNAVCLANDRTGVRDLAEEGAPTVEQIMATYREVFDQL